MKNLVVTCSVFEKEVQRILPPEEAQRAVLLDMSYHRKPKLLRATIQEIIDRRDDADAIVVLYGCCGGIQHLRPRDIPVIIPRANDCFDLMLGAEARFSEFQQEPGTYFLSEGWTAQDGTPAEKLRGQLARFPAEESLVRSVYEGYRRLCFVRTGVEAEASIERAMRSSAELGWTFIEKKAGMTLFNKALTGNWDSDFQVLQPGDAGRAQGLWG